MTNDTLFGGLVAIAQPARGSGYRVNVDAILLAGFAARIGGKTRPARLAYDLGAGAGGVALSLLHLGAVERIVLVEVDAEAARLAATNLESNGWSERGEVLGEDVRAIDAGRAKSADLVVCNPPYFDASRGSVAEEPSRAIARSGELAPFVEGARDLLGKRGRVCFVYPARELATLVDTFRKNDLEPKRMRMVHAIASAPARVVLIEAIRAKRGGLIVEPPVVERIDGAYLPELAALLRHPRVSL